MIKVINIKNYNGEILEHIDQEFDLVSTSEVNGNSSKTTLERIPLIHIMNRRDGKAIPKRYLDESGKFRINQRIDLVRLVLSNGTVRWALDEKSRQFDAEDVVVKSQDIIDLEKDMEIGEMDDVEIKGSLIHPANPDDASDHTYQMKEIIRQCQAFANSKIHRGRIWIGIRDKGGKRSVIGIENEPTAFAPGCDEEKFQCLFMNQLAQLTSMELRLSTSFKYVKYEEHLVARIDVNYLGDVVFYGKNRELNVRQGTAMVRIDDTNSYLAFIRQYKNNNQ